VPTKRLVGATLTSTGNTRATRKGCPNHPIDFKRRLAALACQPETSVAGLALAHGINANLLFKWRRQYRVGKLGMPRPEDVLTGDSPSPRLLPVTLSMAASAPALGRECAAIEIALPNATLRITGEVSPAALNNVLDCLARRP